MRPPSAAARSRFPQPIKGPLSPPPSQVHRVLLPPAGDGGARQSLAFFLHPDDHALITGCGGSGGHPPVTAGDYLKQRFAESYGRS